MLKRRILFSVLAVYFLYICVMYYSFFVLDFSELPEEYIGTVADPNTFLTEREIILSEEYSDIRNFLYFLEIPFEWIVYLFILLLGIGKNFENWALKSSKSFAVQSAVFSFWLSLLTTIVFFPIQLLRFNLSQSYGISAQSFPSWIRDHAIDFGINWLTLLFVIIVLYWLMKKNSEKWWLYAWFIMIPAAFFLMYIQPVVIDPLYNEFTPLQDKELEERILHLAEQAGIPAEHVFQVNMSEKTNTLNAYVTGVGGTSRIVLWDTTLNKLEDNEILFIMAHEMAHYVEKHIYIGIAGYIVLALVILYLTAKILNWAFIKYNTVLNVTSLSKFSSYPLIMLIISVLLFAASPLNNAYSRYLETRADVYAIEMTDNAAAGVSTFQKLAKTSLSQVNPPVFVKWFRYGHPTTLERILLVAESEENED